MSVQEQIGTRLAEVFLVYQEIGEMLSDWDVLQQAEQAQEDYKQQTAQLDEEITGLDAKKNELEALKRKWKIESEIGSRQFRPPVNAARPRADAGQSPSLLKERPRPLTANQKALQIARTQLKKLVGRWGRLWKLSGDVQGRINRIADDPTKPLGEALAMLEWTTFEHRIGSSESDEDHLVRLDGWGAALVEYRERLNGEIDMLETKYRRIIPILHAWIIRDTEAGRRSWEQQVSKTNTAKREEVAKLRGEIASLTAEMKLTNPRHAAVD